MQVTTIANAVRDLERQDIQGVREELAAYGYVTNPDGEPLIIVDESGKEVAMRDALAELDREIAWAREVL